MNLRKAFIVGLGLSVAVLSGCGSDAGTSATGTAGPGGTGPTAGAGGDDPVTRVAVVTALESEYMRLAPRSNPDQRAAMIAYATSLSGVQNAGWTDAEHGDNFFAMLNDETPFAMLDNLVNAPGSPPSSSAAPS